jgi:hypothetical protein
MFGVSVLCLYVGMCRFFDLACLRWDASYFGVFESHIRLFADYRKNDTNWKGHFFDALGDRTLAQHGVIASSMLLGASRPARSCVASIAGRGALGVGVHRVRPRCGRAGSGHDGARRAALGTRHSPASTPGFASSSSTPTV